MSRLSQYEQETIINFNEGDKTAGIYTHNKALRRKLEKLAHERPDECRLEKVSRYGEAADYIVPKSWIKVGPPRKAPPLTEEQKQQRREQLARMRNGKSTAKYPDDSSEIESA